MHFGDVFHSKKAIIGMIHLAGYSPAGTLAQAKKEIVQMYDAGLDAVLVENYFGDVADVTRALEYLQAEFPDRTYGVNILGDLACGYALARKYGCSFLQVDSICGHLSPEQDRKYARWVKDLRERGDPVPLLGGVRFKYQPVRSGRSVEEDLQLATQRCDAVVVTGEGTGISTDLEKIRMFRETLGKFPLIVGAGMTADTCQEQLALSDGAIVGSYFKENGQTERPVDPERVIAFMEKVRMIQGE